MHCFASLQAFVVALTMVAAGVLPSVLHACRMMEMNEPHAIAASGPPCHGPSVVSDPEDASLDTPAIVPVDAEMALACCAWRVAPAPVAAKNPLPEPHAATIVYVPAAAIPHPVTPLPSHLADPPDPAGPARHLRFSQLLI